MRQWDVVVVGAGPAGLSAALILGRARRRVLVCDTGVPRSWAPKRMHAFLTRDGIARSAFRGGQAIEFLKDQYRHCKPIPLMGSASRLLAKAGIPAEETDPGLIAGKKGASTEAAVSAFIEALNKHRHFERETDPPRV